MAIRLLIAKGFLFVLELSSHLPASGTYEFTVKKKKRFRHNKSLKNICVSKSYEF